MRKVVIVDVARTAFGNIGGTIRDFYPTELMAKVIVGILKKSQLIERGGIVDSVCAGSAAHDGRANNFARFSSLIANLPYDTSATFVEMQCGSGIAAINHAAREIATGDKNIIIAGGAESFSQKFVKFPTSITPYKMQAPAAIPAMLAPSAEDNIDMIHIADEMAKKWGITRQDCDEFAYNSQKRAVAAQEAGYFDDEIIAVEVPQRKADPVIFAKDEHVRPDTTPEALAKLRTVYADGVTTAGNASARNDGASCFLMMDEDTALRLGYQPLATWVDGTDCGVDPKLMGIGPVYSNLKLLKRNHLKVSDIDVYECNEAFAAQNLSVIREMENLSGEKIDTGRWNPNGGAIAFGHPNGASGARVGMFAIGEMNRRNGKYAMFSSCCGGGLGVSCLVEKY